MYSLNKSWFPTWLDLPDGQTEEPQSKTSLEIAQLKIDLRDLMMRQIASRRSAAQSIIAKQNSGISVAPRNIANDLSPEDIYTEPEVKISYGCFTGGLEQPGNKVMATVREFDFAQKTISTNGPILGKKHFDACHLSKADTSYIVGGGEEYNLANLNGITLISQIQSWNYTSKQTAALGATLSSGLLGCLGLSDGQKGFIFGGSSGIYVNANNQVRVVNYAPPSISNSGSTLSVGRRNGTGCGNSDTGFLVGGYSAHDANLTDIFNSLDPIEQFQYSSSLLSTLGTPLSGRSFLGASGNAHESFIGTGVKRRYIGGGFYYDDMECGLTRFNYANRSTSSMGSVFPSCVSETDATGNGYSGVWAGGRRRTEWSAVSLTDEVASLDFLTTIVQKLGVRLSAPTTRHTGIQPYGGFI